MGGGDRPGVHVQKEQGRFFCQISLDLALANGAGQYFMPYMPLMFVE